MNEDPEGCVAECADEMQLVLPAFDPRDTQDAIFIFGIPGGRPVCHAPVDAIRYDVVWAIHAVSFCEAAV
ncbi:hypothetical protein OFN51_34165, partial [Escherichia coli]|nr:hypothetical protein [Escherichia coli]